MKKKIVLVEDDHDILYTVNYVLDQAGYEVIALTTGSSLMDDSCEMPDLFILDKRMPDMDGLNVCKHLRQYNGSKDVPIIMISASPKFGPLAIQAGATEYLAKPFNVKNLLEMVGRLI
jgi:DNA-binding response OmpR family regulator